MGPLTIAGTALSSLGANKLRTGLALLGIVIGVAAVISTMSVGRGAQETITSRIEALGTNLLFVRPSIAGQSFFSGGNVVVFRSASGQDPTSTLTLEDAYALKDPCLHAPRRRRRPGDQHVGPDRRGSREHVCADHRRHTGVRVGAQLRDGVRDVHHWRARRHRRRGRRAGLRDRRDPFWQPRPRGPEPPGQRAPGSPLPACWRAAGGTALGNLDSQVLVPITTAHYRLSSDRTTSGGVAVSSINVQIDDTGNREETIGDLATVLRLRHRITEEDDFTITSQEETIETLTETQETFALFLGAIAGISLLVGGIGIMNIMMVSVTERTREIGVRKAMGAKWRDILLQFVSEATLLSLGGGIAGVILGVTLSRLMDGRNILGQTFETAVSGDITVLALAVAVGIGPVLRDIPGRQGGEPSPHRGAQVRIAQRSADPLQVPGRGRRRADALPDRVGGEPARARIHGGDQHELPCFPIYMKKCGTLGQWTWIQLAATARCTPTSNVLAGSGRSLCQVSWKTPLQASVDQAATASTTRVRSWTKPS